MNRRSEENDLDDTGSARHTVPLYHVSSNAHKTPEMFVFASMCLQKTTVRGSLKHRTTVHDMPVKSKPYGGFHLSAAFRRKDLLRLASLQRCLFPTKAISVITAIFPLVLHRWQAHRLATTVCHVCFDSGVALMNRFVGREHPAEVFRTFLTVKGLTWWHLVCVEILECKCSALARHI